MSTNGKSTKEDWEHQEDFDDQQIEAQDLATKVALFPKTGKPYMTLGGIFALANELKIQIEELIDESTDNEYLFKAKAVNKDGSVRWGTASEKKTDTFGYTKAVSKAQRNAFKAFLYGHPKVEEAINIFQGKGKPKIDPQAQKEKDLAAAAIDNALPRLAQHKITKEILWERAKKQYKVASPEEMTPKNWTDLRNAVSGEEFEEWVLKG